ncbi:hypothetical protein DF185_14940 [Marinifilum breve]|uniref:SAM-dependent methyltransferase n=1 Tax=Marinifilum breve TaxID=2184082 RepID=A0A2V3ZW80_9BACT|nr:hypothetical protein [Marinifilum breve]PXX99171.1 hypothetical protein DF185_14940 [Marinifilum breve]
MSGIRYRLKKRLIRLKTYRRKGFGEHSSNAIDLITNVFGAKLHYYAFRDLQQTRGLAVRLLKASCKSSAISAGRANFLKEEILNLKRGKDVDRLIFRLMNYYQVKKPVFIGNGLGYTKAYMAKVDSRIKLCCIGDCLKNEEINSKIFNRQLQINNIESIQFCEVKDVDFIVISNMASVEDIELFKTNYAQILGRSSILVFQNMNRNSVLLDTWKTLKHSREFDFHLNMHSVGILISIDNTEK